MAAATPCALALGSPAAPGFAPGQVPNIAPNAALGTFSGAVPVVVGHTSVAAGAVTRQAVPAVEGAVGDKVGQKLSAVQNTLKAGSDAVSAVHDLAG